MLRLALLLAVGLAACDGETTLPGAPLGWGPASGTLYQPPAAGGGILGDWFFCADPSCAGLSSNGVRFEAGGTWKYLYALGQSGQSDEVYCVAEWTSTYSWDGATLTISDLGEAGDLSCRVTFDDDIATLDCLQGHPTYLKRVSGRVEPCPIYEDLPAGDGAAGS